MLTKWHGVVPLSFNIDLSGERGATILLYYVGVEELLVLPVLLPLPQYILSKIVATGDLFVRNEF